MTRVVRHCWKGSRLREVGSGETLGETFLEATDAGATTQPVPDLMLISRRLASRKRCSRVSFPLRLVVVYVLKASGHAERWLLDLPSSLSTKRREG